MVNYTKSETVAHETAICRELAVETSVCQANVSMDEGCWRMASEAVGRWGRIDGLVNNAGQSVFASIADLKDCRRIVRDLCK